MTKDLKILTSYCFLGGLTILLLNDLLLKELFGNWITGKLSDFAGLFIFPLFWTAIFPRHRKKIFVLTGLIFIFWKSPYSQSFILSWNNLGLLQIARIVDYSDLIALVVLPLALYINYYDDRIKKLSINPVLPLALSFFAFTATSYKKDFDYNKKYDFEFSKSELVRRINLIENENRTGNLPLSLNNGHANYFSIAGASDTLWYYVSRYVHHADTVFKNSSMEIDTIFQYNTPVKDTMYPGTAGVFFYTIVAAKYMKESKTGYCSTLQTKVKLEGDETTSSLTLCTVYTGNCMGMFETDAKTNEKDNLLRAFETECIEKIKNAL
ncbi:MAG: hypothetical protein KKD31_09315 [Bacteroidetes bacterium]|nr:hypothetical protein [Bacteroidota bacterium]